MIGKYWIKLYIEILDDFKMAVLPDRLWRRAVELFLIAGRVGEDGQLPELRQLAWMLHLDETGLSQDLEALAEVGIITNEDSNAVVTNFEKRQAPDPGVERIRKHRERNEISNEKLQTRYTNVTPALQESYTKVTRLTDKKRLTEEINREEKKRGGESGAAAPAATSAVVIDSVPAHNIQVFTEVTGMVYVPSGDLADVMAAMDALRTKHGQELAQYLKPYFQEWTKRGYNKTNCAWLTGWAVAGEIPQIKDAPKERGYGDKKPKPKTNYRDDKFADFIDN